MQHGRVAAPCSSTSTCTRWGAICWGDWTPPPSLEAYFHSPQGAVSVPGTINCVAIDKALDVFSGYSGFAPLVGREGESLCAT